MTSPKFFIEKRILFSLILYFLLSGLLLYHFGLLTGGEAEKYIDNANRILQGHELRNGFFGIFYVAYSLLVAFFVKFNLPLVGIAVVQIVLSALAANCLYRLLQQTLKNNAVAFLFFIAYLVCYPIQRWNFYLYSESFHSSLLLMGLYFFYTTLQGIRSGKWVLMIMLLLILFSRPVGILFWISAIGVFVLWLYHHQQKLLAGGIMLLGILALLGLANSPVTAFINPDSIKRMEVICQVPATQADTSYQEFNRAGLYKAYTVIRDDIGWGNFLSIGFKKLGNFFGMYRPYYSWQNNSLLWLYWIFYPLALIGIFSKQLPEFLYIKWFSISYLLLTSLAIFFTCDDWANRFISPAFPFVLILAAAGWLPIFKRITKS
jgi:hypothetical protein